MKLLLLTATLYFACFNSAAGTPLYTVTVPKAFRVQAVDHVIVNLHNYKGSAVLNAYLQSDQETFSQITNKNLNSNALGKPITLSFSVPYDKVDLKQLRPRVKLVIKLSSSSKDFEYENDILVSNQSGYLFLTTDRPVYRPKDVVYIKVAPLDQRLIPEDVSVIRVTVKTPDGIGVFRQDRKLKPNSFIDVEFNVGERPEIGEWYVEAAFATTKFKSTSQIRFKVDRYVLPTFNVEVHLKRQYLLASDDSLAGTIYARYSYGKNVSGSIYWQVKLRRSPGLEPVVVYREPGTFDVVKRIENGIYPIDLPVDFILEHLPEGETVDSLIKNKGTFIVEASVNGDAEGIIEAGTTPELPFLQSPYAIDVSRTSDYYTPQLAYHIRADILDAVTKTPVSDVPVILRITENGRTSNPLNEVSDDNGEVNRAEVFIYQTGTKTITITTDGTGNAENEVSETVTVQPYTSDGNSYLQITTDGNTLANVGESHGFIFTFNTDVSEIRYSVIARGDVVLSGTKKPNRGARASTLHITITASMVPSARIVAYYMSGGNRMVSSSYWFDIVNQCQTDLTIDSEDEVLPGGAININVTGAPSALVGLKAVDKAAYFIYNKTRLTKKTMFNKMREYDLGCVRNGGSDNRNVYLNAGLVVSSIYINPFLVETLVCPNRGLETLSDVKRKKRDVSEQEKRIKDFENRCEEDGKLKSDEPCDVRGLRVRALYKDLYPKCWFRFLKGCRKQQAEDAKLLFGGTGFGRTPSDLASEQKAIAKARVDFRENILFRTVSLNDKGRLLLPVKASHSITTYEIDGFSMAATPNGFCVANTKDVRVFKDVFIQLYTPFSLKIREQAIIRLSVFNYGDKNITDLALFIQTGDGICSAYREDITIGTASPLRKGFFVAPHTSKSFAFAVLPLELPEGHKVPITAEVRVKENSNYRRLDLITKQIRVEEAGFLRDNYQTFPLEVKEGNPQNITFDFAFPENYVAGSRQCFIYAYTNIMGPYLDSDPETGEPKNVDNNFRLPRGCGEQNMIYSAPNIYTLMYLEAIGKASAAMRQKYHDAIREGYKIELSWRSDRTDPPKLAFAVWDRSPPNLWLNAFVLKVFGKAKQFVDLDVTALCNAMTWLFRAKQQPLPLASKGYFEEHYRTHHSEMKGAVGGRKTLTAYTLIALEEATADLCPALKPSYEASTVATYNYLKREMNNSPFTDRPYAIALLAYAFALHDVESRETKTMIARLLRLSQLTDDNRGVYWNVGTKNNLQGTDLNPYWYSRPQALNVETTAYALLALVEIGRSDLTQTTLDTTKKIAYWLVSHMSEGGVFSSTQDTVIGLQSLATYSAWSKTIDTSVAPTVINLEITGSDKSSVWQPGSAYTTKIDENNANFKHVVPVPESVVNGISVNVKASGNGQGMLSYRCTYKTIVEDEGCHYDLETETRVFDFGEGSRKTLSLTVKVSKAVGATSEAPIVVIGLMSGFIPSEQSLRAISSTERVDGLAQRYDVTQQNVVLYFLKIDSGEIQFTIDFVQIVEDIEPQPAEIKVIDYYEPSIQCKKFYSLPEHHDILRTTNCTSADDKLCTCAEGGCLTCRSRAAQLDKSVCFMERGANEPCDLCDGDDCKNMYAVTCLKNYGYYVLVTEVDPLESGQVFVTFKAKIKEIFKIGSEPTVTNDTYVTFMVRSDCFKGCKDPEYKGDYIAVGSELYITGQKIDVSLDRFEKKKYVFMLDTNAVVERVIPEATCVKRKANFKKKCKPKGRDEWIKDPQCVRFKKFDLSCRNVKALKELIADGCDNVS